MPVSRETSISGPYVPNGVLTSFPFDFKATTPAEVVALDSNGVLIPRSLYSVSMDDDEGGALIFSVAPTFSAYPQIYVAGDPALTQPSDFDNTGPSFNPASVTRAFDRAAARDLKQQRDLDRSFKVPFGEAGMQLPGSSDRAGKYVAFDALGAPMMATGTGVDGDLRGDMAADDGGAMLAYKASATNSRKRTMQEKADEQLLTPADFVQPGDTVLLRLERFVAALGDGVYGRLDADYVIPSMVVVGYKSKFKIHGNGYTITLEDGAATGYGGSALYFVECSEFEVTDLICDGNRANRVPAEDPAHVVVVDKCHNWKFREVQAINGTCDGFLIYAGSAGSGPGGTVQLADCPSHWVMESCTALNNWRQGMSIVEGRFGLVDKGRYGKTAGAWDVHNGPCAGIDLEPDNHPSWDENRVEHITIRDALFDENQGDGVLVTNVNGVRHIKIHNCTFYKNRKSAITTAGENVDILNPSVVGWDEVDYTAKVGAPQKNAAITVLFGAGHTTITNPSFAEVSNGTSSDYPLIYTHGGAADGIVVSNLRSDGTASTIVTANSPYFRFMASSVDLSQATRGFACQFGGADQAVDGVTAIGCPDGFLYAGGARPVIRSNVVFLRGSSDTTQVVINAGDTSYATFLNNRIHPASPIARYGFSFGASARAIDNWVTNMSSTDSHIGVGGSIIKRANYRGDTAFPETAITT